ncbi:MAG TPA: site-specific integrase [Terriglobales bacterium]|jgi:integrase/recombinase XerD|nr:site-specific integrase [Terriglobales bacterium]
MEPRFEQFIRERLYLHNVSPATVEWYTHSFKWLRTEAPTQDELKDAVLRMREKGLKATGCNSAIRAINAYLKWNSSPLKIQQMKEPQIVLPTFTAAQVQRLIAWRPRGRCQRRLHLLVLFLLDTGCRISEALTLHVRDIDLDNLLVTLDGKGRKQRVVPFSFELRKALFRYITDQNRKPDLSLFASRNETRLGRRVMLRDVKLRCRRLGFDPPARTLHAFRHTFAINYLRKGGSVFHLQKVLGHSSLEMTRRYANLITADLQAVHERVSLLSRG